MGSVTARHEAFAPRAGDVALMDDFRGWLDDHLEGSMARLREHVHPTGGEDKDPESGV